MGIVSNGGEGPRSPYRREFAEDGVEAEEFGAGILGDHGAVIRPAEGLSAAQRESDDHAKSKEFPGGVDEISVDDDRRPDQQSEDDGAASAHAVSDLAEAE